MVVLNAKNPDFSPLNFAFKLVEPASTKLTGLLVENLYFSYVPAGGIDAPYFETNRPPSRETVIADIEHSSRMFKEQCSMNGINAEIIVDKGEPIQEIIFESQFVDLIIIDPAINFYGSEEDIPSQLVKGVLAKAECPVLLAPEKYEAAEEIIFCYDGTAASIFAAKQFTYLIPEFRKKKLTLLHVSNQSDVHFDETDRRTMDWLRAHYTSVYYHSLKGETKNELFNYLFMKEKKLVVMGAYGRSTFSKFFRKSNADNLIRMVDLPIFIAHK